MTEVWAFLDGCGWEVLGWWVAAALALDLLAGRFIHEGNHLDGGTE